LNGGMAETGTRIFGAFALSLPVRASTTESMPHHTAPARQFTPHEFGGLVDVAVKAGQRRTPVIETADDGDTNPYRNAVEALREVFPEDDEAFHGAATRFVALMRLFADDRLGSWARHDRSHGEHSSIHPAVIHVAAQMKLTPNDRFPEKRFLLAVAEVAAASYPEVKGWD
jgi:hypothetical protein